ncbi:hypothetical protein BD410DRAFT_901720 [Rickenella mellea]|uniref:Zn(2)-C6 fungal-type domain-containing protein n=1 Tax=Rickenella mellea TaxID=50990 RepID=A0A4Y7PPG6_9AGAM|nr:hypothetical protein BD410DRAFT_901720 [Rickenella mellea]
MNWNHSLDVLPADFPDPSVPVQSQPHIIPTKRPRNPTPCEPCRDSHLKCIPLIASLGSRSVCERCLLSGIICVPHRPRQRRPRKCPADRIPLSLQPGHSYVHGSAFLWDQSSKPAVSPIVIGAAEIQSEMTGTQLDLQRLVKEPGSQFISIWDDAKDPGKCHMTPQFLYGDAEWTCA